MDNQPQPPSPENTNSDNLSPPDQQQSPQPQPTYQPSPTTQPGVSQSQPTAYSPEQYSQPQASPVNDQTSLNNTSPSEQQVIPNTQPPAAQPAAIYPPSPEQSNPQIVVSTHIEDNAAATNIKTKSDRKMSKKLIFGLVIVVIIVVAAASFFILHKKSGNNTATIQPVSISVPSSWKTNNTGIGYTLKAPSSWSVGASLSSDVDGQDSKTVDIAPNGGVVEGNSSDQNSGTISVGTIKLDSNSTSEAAFDNSVTTVTSSEKALLKAFGANVNGLKVTSSNIKINGTPWLEVKTGYPGQYSANLYYWDTNHAIAIIATEQSAQAASKALQTYLLPMAASVQL